MMKLIFLVILPLAWCYGSSGGGAYSYVDSSGNRYGGTYGLKDGRVVSSTGDGVPTHFSDSAFPAFNEFPGAGFAGAGFPGAGFPGAGFPGAGFPGAGFPGYGYGMQFPPHNFNNAAFASAAAGPGYNHHIASIYPGNPGNPNVEKINHYSDTSGPKDSKFYSVSSNSFASSKNINGKESTLRGAETVVNDNGKITHYKVRS